MKLTPNEKKIIKRFEKKFVMEKVVIPITHKKYIDSLIKEIRKAYEEGKKSEERTWISLKEQGIKSGK